MKQDKFNNFVELRKTVAEDSKYYQARYKNLTPQEHFVYQRKLKERMAEINNLTQKG